MIDIAQAGEHVQDADAFHIPVVLWQYLPDVLKGAHPHPGSIPLPKLFDFGTVNVLGTPVHLELQLTKFMVLELIAALAMLAIFVPLARRIRTGEPVRGRVGNFFEAILVFLRDEVARPAIGHHDADRFLPYIWSVFFFVLFCNLLGMLPWLGSPTGALSVTAALAAVTFGVVVAAGMMKYGPLRYWTGLVPHMDLPLPLAIFLKPMLLVIEIAGLLIKHVVLAVRLLANMFAGHLVLAVIMGFIAATAHMALAFWAGITAVSLLGSVALSLLELFVAFLQAYIFAFLSALFIGMSVHQH